MTDQVRPEEAARALTEIDQRQEQVIRLAVIPTWYWWAIAVLMVTFAAAGEGPGEGPGASRGRGRLDGRATLTGPRAARMVIALRGSKGFLRAAGNVTVEITEAKLTYRGTATVTSVDGAARGLKGRRLKLRGTGDLVDNRFVVSLTG